MCDFRAFSTSFVHCCSLLTSLNGPSVEVSLLSCRILTSSSILTTKSHDAHVAFEDISDDILLGEEYITNNIEVQDDSSKKVVVALPRHYNVKQCEKRVILMQS